MSENVKQPAGSSSAKSVAAGVVIAIIVMTIFYVLLDRKAPSSSRGIVSAHVVQIAPRVSGEVIQVHVEDDAVIDAGQPLFTIDPRPFELALRQAEANLTIALQNVNASSASLVAAQAAVTQARTALQNARNQAERVYRLEERGLVSASEGDRARADVTAAEAQLESAQAKLESARAQLGPEGADNPNIKAAEARLEQAQYDLASTTVVAPYYGVVTNVSLAEGQFIGAGNPALTFIDAKAAWITVDLRENQLGGIDPGDAARVLFDSIPGRIFEGRVQSVAWGINTGRNVQGGLVVNQPNNRWFEPARRIPVRVELVGGIEAWPRSVPVGGKVHVVVFSDTATGFTAWIARTMQRLRSWFTILH